MVGTDQGEEELTKPGSSRVIIGCSADTKPKLVAQAVRLIQSIRWFGGSLADTPIVFCAVDSGDPFDASEFAKLNAEVQMVEPFPSGNPPANKLQFFELDFSGYDTAILLDCDTVVVQDPMPFIKPGVFQAKMVSKPTTPNDVLVKLCRTYGLPTPEAKYLTTLDLIPTMWHANSGVIILPVELIPVLIPRWRHYESELAGQREVMGKSWVHRNQASLTLAYLETGVPFDELPPAMNFPLRSASRLIIPHLADVDPVILHHHDVLDEDGCLRPSPYVPVQARIHGYNQRVRTERGDPLAEAPADKDAAILARDIQIEALQARSDALQSRVNQTDEFIGSPTFKRAVKIAGWLEIIPRKIASAKRRLGLAR